MTGTDVGHREHTDRQAAGGGPLDGLRVVEFGQLLAGPYVGTLLGDFGADVIKVEPPPKGDAMRDWGRLQAQRPLPGGGDGAGPQQALDHAQPAHGGGAGRSPWLGPTRDADVLVENFRPGTHGELGASGPTTCTQYNPGRRLRARVRLRADPAPCHRHRPGFASAGEAVGRAAATSTAHPGRGAAAQRGSRWATR